MNCLSNHYYYNKEYHDAFLVGDVDDETQNSNVLSELDFVEDQSLSTETSTPAISSPSKLKPKPTARKHQSESPKKRSPGRKSGSINWSDPETMLMLNIAEEIVPLGGKAWQKVSDILFERSGRKFQRDKDACSRRYNKLLNTKPETGTTCPPANVQLARAIKTKIDTHQSIGFSSLNDDGAANEEELALKSTNTLDNETGRRPINNRQSRKQTVEAINSLGDKNIEAAQLLADAFKSNDVNTNVQERLASVELNVKSMQNDIKSILHHVMKN